MHAVVQGLSVARLDTAQKKGCEDGNEQSTKEQGHDFLSYLWPMVQTVPITKVDLRSYAVPILIFKFPTYEFFKYCQIWPPKYVSTTLLYFLGQSIAGNHHASPLPGQPLAPINKCHHVTRI